MPHILLADDDQSIGVVARLGLRRAGYEVTVVEDGVAALAAARAGECDAVLLDWMLPDMDGIQVCRALKADPATARLPVIFLTAVAHSGSQAEAVAAGAVGVIGKPFNPVTLGAEVEALLNKS